MGKKIKWVKNIREKYIQNYILDDTNGIVYLSYNDNDFMERMRKDLNIKGLGKSFDLNLDSQKPETAIVLVDDNIVGGEKCNRYLICKGDRRKDLEELYPDVEKLKEYWKKEGGHFWSDNLGDDK